MISFRFVFIITYGVIPDEKEKIKGTFTHNCETEFFFFFEKITLIIFFFNELPKNEK